MKYIILIADGMADYQIQEIGMKTPMEAAMIPNMDYLAKNGMIGMVKTVVDKLPPGSDVTNLAILGYDPRLYYTGRSPLEAAGMGVTLEPYDVAYRCNFVSLKNHDGGYDIRRLKPNLIMGDYSAGHISTEEARELIYEINDRLGNEEIQFYPGVSYRHLMVWEDGKAKVATTPPHDILDKKIGSYLPHGDGNDLLIELMDASIEVLKENSINEERVASGKAPANCIWLWGQGKAPKMPRFDEKYHLSGSMITAVDLIKGLGRYAGFDIVSVPGATGYLDTNYKGKAEYALSEIRKKDIVYVHIEAPDEAGHAGDLKAKIKALEDIDSLVVGTLIDGLRDIEDYRIMVTCDHRTPVSIRSHTSDPVPFLIYDNKISNKSDQEFNERNAGDSKIFIDPGYKLMDFFLGRK